jgi:hypothetical protein
MLEIKFDPRRYGLAQFKIVLMFRLLLIPALFVLGGWSTLLLTHSHLSHRHLQLPAGQKMIGNIDEGPDSSNLVNGKQSKLVLSGWAVFVDPSTHLKQLEICIDQKTLARVTSFSSRADVADAYARPDFELSGWRTEIAFDGVPTGEHTLTVRAVADNGDTAELPPHSFKVQ